MPRCFLQSVRKLFTIARHPYHIYSLNLSQIVIKKKKITNYLPFLKIKSNGQFSQIYCLECVSLEKIRGEKLRRKFVGREIFVRDIAFPIWLSRLDKRIVPVNLISGIKRIPFYIDRYSIITLRMLAERYKDESVSSDDSKTEFPSPIANRASRREQVCHQFFQSLSLFAHFFLRPFFFSLFF